MKILNNSHTLWMTITMVIFISLSLWTSCKPDDVPIEQPLACEGKCQNGGICTDTGCDCLPNFSGQYCEINDSLENAKAAKDNFVNTMHGTSDPNQGISPTDGPKVINTEISRSGNTSCTTKTISWVEKFGELVLLGGLDLYPGGVYTAESISTGAYQAFPYGILSDICISSNLPFSKVKFTHNGLRSSFRQGYSNYMEQPLQRSVPIVADFTSQFVYSYEQLAVAMGTGLKVGKWVDIRSSFSLSGSSTKSRMIVKLIQPFYTLDVDERPVEDFYSTPPTAAQMQQMNVDQYGLVYVNKVVYGRQLFFMIESESSESDLRKAVNAEFGFWKVNGEFEYDEENKKIFQNASKRVVIMGGDPTLGADVIIGGLKEIDEYIKRGAAFDPKTNPGVPLSYQLKRVKDNAIFNTVIASEYKIQECEVIPPNTREATFQANFTGPICPPLVRGDREIGYGLRPKIKSEAEIYLVGDKEVWARIYFDVQELDGDKSRATITERIRLYKAPSGEKIKKIYGSLKSTHEYFDTDKNHPTYFSPSSGPVEQFISIGDTNGDDLGNCNSQPYANDRSKLSIKWNPIKVLLEEQ